MSALEWIAGVWFAILEVSALGAARLTSRVMTRRRLTAVEGSDHELLLSPTNANAGSGPTRLVLPQPGDPIQTSRLLRRSHVTIELDPSRFVFHTIELPARAAEFIEAIVRNQIDRLTPWAPDHVVFGWVRPVTDATEGSIAVTVAATNKDRVLPLLKRVQDMGATRVDARVSLPSDLVPAGAGRSVVVAHGGAASVAANFWRRGLGAASAVVVALVIGSSLYAQVETFRLADAADDMSRQNATKRAAILKSANEGDPVAGARRLVDQRKTGSPYITVVIEALARILPDTSYVTSIEVNGTRLRLVGFTNDAPSLISLIDSSDVFAEAAFFAPTTRLPDDQADRFSIEATIRPGVTIK